MIDVCFNCVTSCVKVLCWLEKKEERKKEKKMDNSGFRLFSRHSLVLL